MLAGRKSSAGWQAGRHSRFVATRLGQSSRCQAAPISGRAWMLPEHPRKGRCTAANAHLRLRLTAARSCPRHRTRTKHWKAAAKSIVATAVSHAGPTPSSPSIRLSRESPLNVQLQSSSLLLPSASNIRIRPGGAPNDQMHRWPFSTAASLLRHQRADSRA